MVPPWNLLLSRSLPNPERSLPGVLTTNWSVAMKSPTSYLSRAKILFFSGTAFFFATPGYLFLALPNKQDSQTGTAHFAAVANFGWMIGPITCLVPLGSSTRCDVISSCMRYIFIPYLQFHNRSSLWALDRFSFSVVPTQGPQNWV